MIKEAIEQLIGSHSLTMEDASGVMREIMEGEATPAQLGAFLTALRVKGESAEEMAGMAAVMREKALRVELEGLLVDTAGTGGDGKGTFNISTAAAFVGAACGVKMAKHGNRAASGACGSADVLEELGVVIDLGPEGVKRCIEEVGIGFMFAPAFHPAMKYAAPVRRELGIRTVFNILGPLTNPAGAQGQLLGAPNPEAAEKMAQVLNLLGSQHSIVVHGDDGLDELTLSADTQIWEIQSGNVQRYKVSPTQMGLPPASLSDIRGGDKTVNARIILEIFDGRHGPARDVVLLNSAGVMVVGGIATDLPEGIAMSKDVIDSGAAAKCVDALVNLSQKLAKEAS